MNPGVRAILFSGKRKGKLPLDGFNRSEVRIAIALKKLRSDYNGPCVRLRRSSDNAEQEFGFVNNLLDWAAIATFAGGSDVFIVKLFDQASGIVYQSTVLSNQYKLNTVIKRIDGATGSLMNTIGTPVSTWRYRHNGSGVTELFDLQKPDSTNVFYVHGDGTTGGPDNYGITYYARSVGDLFVQSEGPGTLVLFNAMGATGQFLLSRHAFVSSLNTTPNNRAYIPPAVTGSFNFINPPYQGDSQSLKVGKAYSTDVGDLYFTYFVSLSRVLSQTQVTELTNKL